MSTSDLSMTLSKRELSFVNARWLKSLIRDSIKLGHFDQDRTRKLPIEVPLGIDIHEKSLAEPVRCRMAGVTSWRAIRITIFS